MGAINPKGLEKFWFNGLPFEGLKSSDTKVINGEDFWFKGLPFEFLFSSTGLRKYNLFEIQLDMDRA